MVTFQRFWKEYGQPTFSLSTRLTPVSPLHLSGWSAIKHMIYILNKPGKAKVYRLHTRQDKQLLFELEIPFCLSYVQNFLQHGSPLGVEHTE